MPIYNMDTDMKVCHSHR